MIRQKILKCTAFFLSLFFGTAGQVAAQYGVVETTYKLNGRVVDATTMNPLPGVELKLTNDKMYDYTALSNQDGTFTFYSPSWFWNSGNLYLDAKARAKVPDYIPFDTSFTLIKEKFKVNGDRGHWEVMFDYSDELLIKMKKLVSDTSPDEALAFEPLPADSMPAVYNLSEDTEQDLSIDDINDQPTTDEGYKVRVYPNPSSGKFCIQVTSHGSDDITLLITDASYRTVYIRREEVNPGENNFYPEIHKLAAGTYLLAIKGRRLSFSQKIIISL